MSIVKAKNFTFSYPGVEDNTIDGISIDIKHGEVIGLVGPLGAGKTTLCMTIAGFAPSVVGGDAIGELRVLDHNRTETSGEENEGDVGMVFENYGAQLVQLKVIDEVTTPIMNRGVSEQEAENQAHQLLQNVGFNDDIKNKRIWELSGGQQQRVAIAATLAMEPQILIFDSVIDKLDPQGQEQVKNIIIDQARQKTLIIVDKDPNFLLQIADRLVILVAGKIIAQGKPEVILQDEVLLHQADIEPPLSLHIARSLGISDSPLIPEDLERTLTLDFKRIFQSKSPHLENQQLFKQPQPAKSNFGKPLVCVRDVTFCYSKETKILENVSFEIREGEVHAFVGLNGAGKTTTVKLINGLLKPSFGNVLVCDEDICSISATDLALKVGTVFQNPDEQISERTVKDEIAFGLKERQYERNGLFSKCKRYENDYIEKQVSRACELVGIDKELLELDPTLLPRGQRKLVTIAQALVLDPKVLLLDEPGIGLGATSHGKIKQMIAHFCEQGKAVLLVSNNVDFVAEVADTLTILSQGRAMMQGSLNQVFAAENWERLKEHHMNIPSVAQLAQRFGIQALRCDQLVSKLVAMK